MNHKTPGLTADLDEFVANERRRREEAMQRRAGVWVTVDGGQYEDRRTITQLLGDHLNSLGFSKVQERVGPQAKLEPICPVLLVDGESTQARLQRSFPQLPLQPVTFVVPEHNPPVTPEGFSTVYSGRAECMRDAEEVVFLLIRRGMKVIGTTYDIGYFGPDQASGEVMVEYRFEQPVHQADIHDALNQIEDTHVLDDTLEPLPLVNNPCVRNRKRN